MSNSETREKNKQKVVETALNFFVEQGIDQTKVKDVAESAGLTERSVFRYFPTKADLVLAAAVYFWEQTVQGSKEVWESIEKENKPGTEQILQILTAYAFIFFERKKELIFIGEAELYLYRLDMLKNFKSKPVTSYKSGTGPLSKAIRREIKAGNLKESKELELFYLNCFDSVLGLLQKLATQAYDNNLTEDEQKERLSCFCKSLVKSLSV